MKTYITSFHDVVLFEFEVREDAIGPSIQEGFRSDILIMHPKVSLPGKVVAIHAPSKVFMGVDWQVVAHAFAVPLHLPEKEKRVARKRRFPGTFNSPDTRLRQSSLTEELAVSSDEASTQRRLA